MIAGGIAAAFPDVDFLLAGLGDGVHFLADWHRGITHSLVMLPIWAIILGILMRYWMFRREHGVLLCLLAAVALMSHILADLLTVYGTQLFAPISDWRGHMGTTFVIDPWLSGLLVLGCVASLRAKWPAIVCIGVLFVYIGYQFGLLNKAEGVASAYAEKLSVPVSGQVALPQPFSPFNWKLIVETADFYAVAHVNLMDDTSAEQKPTLGWGQVIHSYQPVTQLRWKHFARIATTQHASVDVAALWKHPNLAGFRRFARYPVLHETQQTRERTCLWFTDLRYVLPKLTPPFRYGLCRQGEDADWSLQRLGRSFDGLFLVSSEAGPSFRK